MRKLGRINLQRRCIAEGALHVAGKKCIGQLVRLLDYALYRSQLIGVQVAIHGDHDFSAAAGGKLQFGNNGAAGLCSSSGLHGLAGFDLELYGVAFLRLDVEGGFFRAAIGQRSGGFGGLELTTRIAEELNLPPVKIHCSVLAEDAIKAAIADYKTKQGKGEPALAGAPKA